MKDNEAFALFDGSGMAPRIYRRELGVYFRDTRCLDTWELSINDEQLTVLTRKARSPSRSVSFVMTNRDMQSLDGPGVIPRDTFCVRRELSLEGDALTEHLEVVNYDARPHTLVLERRAGSAFNDIFEVRGTKRARRGQILPPAVGGEGREVLIGYDACDGNRYTTRLESDAPCNIHTVADGHVAMVHRLAVPSQGTVTLTTRASFQKRSQTRIQMPDAEPRILPPWAQVVTNNPLMTAAFRRASEDISMLLTRRDGRLYPDAGIPWFCAPFGRDGILTAYQTLPWCPEIAASVLAFVFEHLGSKTDPFTDEEPGKVFHENRYGEMAALREIPFVPYYGAVDSTPLALMLLGEYVRWTGESRLAATHWDAACQALAWIRSNIAASPHGFLTYKCLSDRGLANQGWKDSHNSVMHADGRLATAPIALCEVQGYAYRAMRSMASLAKHLNYRDDAERWAADAKSLRQRFRQRFWRRDREAFAIAVDGEGQPCNVLASNQGHCLWTRIAHRSEAAGVARHLMSPAMFSGHGIRTLATCESAYNPLSYHNGSIWPHDNSLIAEGLRQYGEVERLGELCSALFSVAERSDDHGMPELFCGFSRREGEGPVPYDVACKPQAWAAGSMFLLLKASLGLDIDSDSGSLIFKAPQLPAQFSEVEVRGLVVRGESLDVVVRKGSIGATVELLKRDKPTRQVMIVN